MTLSGTVDAGIQQIDAKGNKFTNSAGNNGSATTAFIFAGTEDLGGGKAAVFQLEIDPALADTTNRTKGTSATGTTSNTPSSLGNGQSFVGLNTTLGNIKFGTPNTTTLAANGDGNQGFGTAIGSGYRVTSFDAVRFQNSLRYDTPSFNGFSAGYLQSAKNSLQANVLNNGQNGNLNNQTNGRDAATEISLAYANGPLTVRYADLTIEQWADVALVGTGVNQFNTATWSATDGKEFKLKTLSAKYDINTQASVSYFNQSISSEALVVSAAAGTASTTVYDRKTNGIAASYQATPTVKFLVNYAKATNGANATSSAASKADLVTKVLGLGADYSLSKRTTAYVRYERDQDGIGARDITGYTAATGNTTYKATAVGIRHTF